MGITAKEFMTKNPTHSWSDGQLLQYLMQGSKIAPSGETNGQIIRALDLLLQRKLHSHTPAMKTMIAISKDRGSIRSISSMASGLMLSSIEHRPKTLEFFERELQTKQSEPFLVVASIVIDKLDRETRKRFSPYILSQLMTMGETDEISNKLIELLEPSSKRIAKKVTNHLGKYLDSLDEHQVIFAVRIATKVGGKALASKLIRIIGRVEEDWYPNLNREIRRESCRFFEKHPDERAKSYLFRLLISSPSDAVADALAGYNTKEVCDKVLDIITNANTSFYGNQGGNSWDIVKKGIRSLDKMDPSKVNLKRLVGLEDLLASETRYSIQRIIKRVGEPGIPILWGLLKSKRKSTYEFAVDCLKNSGVNIEELSQLLGLSPVNQLIEFFSSKSGSAINLLESKDLGSSLKGSLKRFDFFLLTLLSSFNFVTLYVDPSGKAGVDVVGISPFGLTMIVAGATASHPKDDLQKLRNTIREMTRAMPHLMSRYNVLPVLFSKTEDFHPLDAQFAAKNGLIALASPDIEQLQMMSISGRSSEDLVTFLEGIRWDSTSMLLSQNLGS